MLVGLRKGLPHARFLPFFRGFYTKKRPKVFWVFIGFLMFFFVFTRFLGIVEKQRRTADNF